MTARTLIAFAAAAFFAYLALFYVAPGAVMVPANDPDSAVYSEELGGTELALAVTSAVRTLSVGLAILSLTAVEWGPLTTAYRESEARRRAAEQGAEQGGVGA